MKITITNCNYKYLSYENDPSKQNEFCEKQHP